MRAAGFTLALIMTLGLGASSSFAAKRKPERTKRPAGQATTPATTRTTTHEPAARQSSRGRATVDTTGAAKPMPTAMGEDATPSSQSEGERVGAAATSTGGSGKPAKTRVYTFGAMDVEGKLKTPQLLYFLNRVKLELEMSAPDRRSFMKELEKSADDPNL